MTVPADTVDTQNMTVDQSAVTPLVEIWVEFALTAEQVAAEKDLHTAVTLATRATNLLSQGEDLLIFQGKDAFNNDSFKNNKIRVRGGPAGDGLLKSAEETIPIKPVDEASRKYGENTFAGVAKAYADLQGQGQYGPYALVLPTTAYADTYAPLKDTLVTPADRIKPLVTAGFYGTGTLPGSNGANPDASLEGVLVSLGGNTMDLVVGMDATTAFMQVDDQGLYRFRVFERFALRPKDGTAIVDLEFAAKAGATTRSAASGR
jgi:uncharacterized linocin/CFP29 family protein